MHGVDASHTEAPDRVCVVNEPGRPPNQPAGQTGIANRSDLSLRCHCENPINYCLEGTPSGQERLGVF
jgi:hypothetical protein